MASFVPSSSQCLHSGYHHATLRDWHSIQSKLSEDNFIYPVFVTDEDDDAIIPIHSLPAQSRFGINRLIEFLQPLVDGVKCRKLKAVIVFGVPTNCVKDNKGSFADDTNSPTVRTIKRLREEFPTLLVCADVCLCAYTDHGHCGLLKDKVIDNQPSIERLGQVAVTYAQAGAHVVAPSDMMDGRVGAIKEALREAGLSGTTTVMSYSAKFASCYYGPFRDAAGSAPGFGDRKCYQLPPGSRGLAMRAVKRDIEEGADMVMVKPGVPYLDIISEIRREHPNHIISVYHVSGEYASLCHAAEKSAIHLKTAVMENMQCLRRAGADLILTYFTPKILHWLQDE